MAKHARVFVMVNTGKSYKNGEFYLTAKTLKPLSLIFSREAGCNGVFPSARGGVPRTFGWGCGARRKALLF